MPPASAKTDRNPLRRRLAALRRRMHLVAGVRGVSLFLAVVISAVVAAVLLDCLWHLPALVRAGLLVGMLSAGVIITVRFLLLPLAARSDDLTLALRVEETFPELNDSLASTVEFLDQANDPNASGGAASRSLKLEAVRRAMSASGACDFNRVVKTRDLRLLVPAGLAACALACTLFILFPAPARTALARLANPFGGKLFPTKTNIALDSLPDRIGRGQAYEVGATISGDLPADGSVVFRFDGFPGSEHKVEIKRQPNGTGRLVTRLEGSRVQRHFRFQVKANDAVTPEFAVQVLPPPSLVPLDGKPSPQMELRFPAYTDLPSPQHLSPGTGNIDAVSGTTATLRAAADRPLRRAWIEFRPELEDLGHYLGLGVFGAAHLPGGLNLLAIAQEAPKPVEAVLGPDRKTFTIDFIPRLHGSYRLYFEDEVGLKDFRPFECRVQTDPAPTVQLNRPSASRDVLKVLPTAVMTLEVIADDPQYALRSVFLEYRIDKTETPRHVQLYHHQSALAESVAPLTGPAILTVPPHPRPIHLEFRQKLALSTLTGSDGGPLRPGDVVYLQACADDFDDVTTAKQPGRSHEIEIHIVDANTLDVVLTQEQARIQQELLRLREKEREALQKVRTAENKLKKGEKLTEEDLAQLLQAQETQQQIRERVGTRKEGLRAETARVQDTLRQNGLHDPGTQERMAKVSRELARLADNELQKIEPKLTDARRQAELLEEKVRAERQEGLKQRAKEARSDAKAADKQAADREEQADNAERQADRSDNKTDEARHRREARQQREKAEDLRRKARELRKQAERDLAEAEQKPDPEKPRQTLTEARRQQEEVEKTLEQLLQDMGPASSREIKAEAGRLLQEQRTLQERAKDLEKETVGKKPEELTPRQNLEKEDLRNAQNRLKEQTEGLLRKMDKVAKDQANKDPEVSQEMKDAADQAAKDRIVSEMQEATQKIQDNQLNDAQKSQEKSSQGLQNMVKNLKEQRQAELDRLVKKMREAEEKLDKLFEEQERLKKKIDEANKIQDKEQREEALKRLSRQQKQLKKDTEDMVKQLSRLRAARASQTLGQAGGEMGQAEQQLSRGEKNAQNQEDVLDRLAEAREELEKARKQAEEELSREQLARVADKVQSLKERQETLISQVTEIQKDVEKKGWRRGGGRDLGQKAEAQKGLGEETTTVATEKLTGTPVFARMLKRSGEDMNRAGANIESGFKDQQLDDQAIVLQKQALDRLDRLLKAIKEEMGEQPGGGGGGGEAGGGDEGDGDGGGAAPPSDDSVPPLAQLKLLRDMQKEINARTATFKKEHPNPKMLDEKGKAELQSIQRDEKDVAELVNELTRPADEPGAEGGDKKRGDREKKEEDR